MDPSLQDTPNKRENKQAFFRPLPSDVNEATALLTTLPLNSQSTNLPSTPTTPGQQNGWPPMVLEATARELWSPTTQIYARGWPTASIPPSPLSFNDFRFVGDSIQPPGGPSVGGEFVTPNQPIQDTSNPFFFQSATTGFGPGTETASCGTEGQGNTSLSSGDSQWQMYLTGSFSNPLNLNTLECQQPNDSGVGGERSEGNYGPTVEDAAFASSHLLQGLDSLGSEGAGVVTSMGRSDGALVEDCTTVLRPEHQLLGMSHEYHASYLHSHPSEGLPAAVASTTPVVSASTSSHRVYAGEGSLPHSTHPTPFPFRSNPSPQNMPNSLEHQRFRGRAPTPFLRFAQQGVPVEGQLSPSQRDSYFQQLPLRLRAPAPLRAPAVPRHSRMATTGTGLDPTASGGPASPVTPPATDVGSPPIPRQLFVASTPAVVAHALSDSTYRRGLSGWGTTGNSPPSLDATSLVRQASSNPSRGRKRQSHTLPGAATHDPGSVASYVEPLNVLTERASTTSRRPSSSSVGGIDLSSYEHLPPRRSKFRKVSHRDSSDDDYEPADDGGDSDSDCYLPSRSASPEYVADSSNEHHSHSVDSRRGSVILRTYSSTKRRKQGKARGSAALALAVVSQMAQETSFDHSSIALESHPGIRKRKNHPIPLPVPVPNLNKKSRGRKVPYVVDLSSPGQGGSDVGAIDNSQGHVETPSATSPKGDDEVDEADEDYATSRQGSVRPSSRRKASTPAPVLVDGERTYVCVVAGCGKCFVRGEHLKRHVRSIHTHDKPHKCPYHGCGKSFSRRDNLGQHTRIHIQTGV